MKAIQASPNNTLPVRAMCRVLGVSASGYYAWRVRGPSKRAAANAKLTQEIRKVHKESDATYGAPRIHAQLRQDGHCVGKKRVARLMKRAGIAGVSRRRGFTVTTERDKRQRPAPDLVQRQFVADAPDVLWIADMTYIPTWTGFMYLAVVLDVFSRKVVGWAMGEHMSADLVTGALDMALYTRRPESSVIHHSDQGTQYTSIAFGNRCNEMGVRPSMGSVGDAYDNAMAESFFATLECELLERSTFRSKAQAKTAVFAWIEGRYNRMNRSPFSGRHQVHGALSTDGHLGRLRRARRWPSVGNAGVPYVQRLHAPVFCRSIPAPLKLSRCNVAQRRVPPLGVVVADVFNNGLARLLARRKVLVMDAFDLHGAVA